MRVFFHLSDGVDTIYDPEGVEVREVDLENAIKNDIEELLREFPDEDWGTWAINVTDDNGRVLYKVLLDHRAR